MTEDEKELKNLFQYAKEKNLVSLCIWKRVHISEVMDTKSTPSKIKQMVKYTIGYPLSGVDDQRDDCRDCTLGLRVIAYRQW
jgi:hypothetical protein